LETININNKFGQNTGKPDKNEYIERFGDHEEDDYENEKYDIPTFLRRQAD
jgi:hypothetical protein